MIRPLRGAARPAAALLLFASPCPPRAAAQAARELPASHWAYAAVSGFAAEGLIQGYPRDTNVFAGRTVTRYEMASFAARILTRLMAIRAGGGSLPPERLTVARNLMQELKVELTVIGTDMEAAEALFAGLPVSPVAPSGTTLPTPPAPAVSQWERERQELDDLRRQITRHHLNGYLQAQFASLLGPNALFTSGAGGTGQRPTLGAPAVGGSQGGFLIRRGRLRWDGPISKAADYVVQLDATSIGPVNLRDAFITLHPLPARNLHLRVGQFVQPFTFELVYSSRLRESPDRALGFSDSSNSSLIYKQSVSSTPGQVTPGSVLPLFINQDRDVGAQVAWDVPTRTGDPVRLTLGVFNGEGRDAGGVRNLNRGLDVVGRVEGTLPVGKGKLALGASGYYGALAVRSAAPTEGTPAPFRSARRQFLAADLRYLSPRGQELRFEYLGGAFEVTPDRAQFLENNHASAWYLMARQPVAPRLDLALKYDAFYPVSGGRTAGGLPGSDLARKTMAAGLLYRMDAATRFRLWYQHGLTPFDPSAASGPLRDRLGLMIAEVQVEY